MVKLDEKYADIMSDHPYGIALYRPLPHSVLKLGACGYFDDGHWNNILDLEDDKAFIRNGLKSVTDELEKVPLETGIRWEPLLSMNTKKVENELSAGV